MFNVNLEKQDKEFSFRAIFWGIIIGLLLMLLTMYLTFVIGMDMNVSPIASLLGIFLIPILGGATTKKEVNIMQTCASAVVFSSAALSMIYAIIYMGYDLTFFEVLIPLFLVNIIGVCFITIFRKQYVEDPSLSFPQATMAKIAVDKVGQLLGNETRILLISILIGFIFVLLQNMKLLPQLLDFTPYLPDGMTLGIYIMPLMIGMGYIIGAKVGLFLIIASLLVNLVLGPIGMNAGWFENPATNYSSMQNFNLSVVIGMTLFSSLVPIIKQRKAFLMTFKVDRNAIKNDKDNVPIKITLFILFIAIVGLAIFCNYIFKINVFYMILFTILGILFSFISVRVVAESGLSAVLALGIFQILIVNIFIKDAIISIFICFLTSSMMVLAQNTMNDLKTGQFFGSSPVKQVYAQIAGIIPGCIVGLMFLYAILNVYGMDSSLFSFPIGKMYIPLAEGLSNSGSDIFNLSRFAIGGLLGTLFSLISLPAGGIALAIYLAPSAVLPVGLGGIIRFLVNKFKGNDIALKYENAATGIVIGDALVSIGIVIITMLSV